MSPLDFRIFFPCQEMTVKIPQMAKDKTMMREKEADRFDEIRETVPIGKRKVGNVVHRDCRSIALYAHDLHCVSGRIGIGLKQDFKFFKIFGFRGFLLLFGSFLLFCDQAFFVLAFLFTPVASFRVFLKIATLLVKAVVLSHDFPGEFSGV